MNEFESLRSLVDDAEPSAEQVERMRAALIDHIANAEPAEGTLPAADRADTGRRWWSDWLPTGQNARAVTALGAVAVIAVAVVAVVAVASLRPDPASAVLDDIYLVVETIPNEDFSETALELRSEHRILVGEPVDLDDPDAESIYFILPLREVRRIATDGTIQIELTTGNLEFLTPVDAATADVLGERLHAGEVQTSTLPPSAANGSPVALTDDPDVLAQRLDRLIKTWGPPDVPYNVQMFRNVTSMLNSTAPTPQQRAALLRVLATVPGLSYPAPSVPGTVEVTIDHVAGVGHPDNPNGDRIREGVVIDSNGWVASTFDILLDGYPDQGVPPGTVQFDRRYEPPIYGP